MRIILFIPLLIITVISAAQSAKDIFLIARTIGEKVLATNDTVRVFGFAEDLGSQPNVPGPTITANEGDSVHIDLWNVSQGAPHTIHLHGLDVDQQNDGVPHLSFEIPHMKHGFYHFKAPHAGTYLYHCHVASTVHVQAGMYGLVIINPSDGSKKTWNNGYEFNRQYSFLTSEIDTVWHQDSVLDHHYDPNMAMHPVKIPVFNPQYFLINGFSDGQLAQNDVNILGVKDEIIYLRFANIGYEGNTINFPTGLNAQIISSDGRPLPSVVSSDSLVIFPGERYGVLLNPLSNMVDQVSIEYFNLNTLQVDNKQNIAVDIKATNGINKLENAPSIKAYPNPFSSSTTLSLDYSKNSKAQITVYNSIGNAIQHFDTFLNKGTNQISINDPLEAGVYFITLIIDGEIQTSIKVIKL